MALRALVLTENGSELRALAKRLREAAQQVRTDGTSSQIGMTDEEMDYWAAKLEWIAASGGTGDAPKKVR